MHRRKYARHIQTEGECCKHANPSIVRREGIFVLCLKKKPEISAPKVSKFSNEKNEIASLRHHRFILSNTSSTNMCLSAVRFSRVYVRVFRSRVKKTYFMRASKSITLNKFRASIILLYADSSFNLVYISRNQDVIFHRSPPAAFPAS